MASLLTRCQSTDHLLYYCRYHTWGQYFWLGRYIV